MLVLVLLALVATVAAPRLLSRGPGSMSNDLFVQDVLAAVRYAQKAAVATRCGTQFDPSGAGYTVTRQNGCTGGVYTDPVRSPATGNPGYAGTAPAGVAVSSSVDPFRFDSLGRALDTTGAVTDVTVTVGTRTIVIAGETGYAYAP